MVAMMDGTEDRTLRVLAIDHHWPSARGGVGTFNRDLCIALANAGAEVYCQVLAATQEDLDHAQRSRVRLLSTRVRSGSEGERMMPHPRLPMNVPVDVIIGHGRVSGRFAEQYRAHWRNAVYLHFVHTDPDEMEWHRDPTEDPQGRLAELKWNEELLLMRAADGVLAVGPLLQERAALDLEPADDLEVRPIRIDPGFDSPDGNDVSWRRPLSRRQKTRILILGRLVDAEIKGVDIAARAVAEAIRIRPGDGRDIQLMLLGVQDGQQRATREAVQGWTGLEGLDVRLRAYTTDSESVRDELVRADLVLMPSRAEGFGLAGAEAIKAGTPVLVSGRSGLARLLEERAPGLVVPVTKNAARDGEEWGQAIARVLRQPAEVRLRAAADLRDRLQSTVTWAKAADDVLETASVLLRADAWNRPNHVAAFICHAGADEFADRLTRSTRLSIDHVTPFHWPDRISTKAAMVEVLTKAEAVLFVLTAESARLSDANFCVAFLRLAVEWNKPVVVLRQQYGARPPVDLPRSVEVDFTSGYRKGLADLAVALATIDSGGKVPIARAEPDRPRTAGLHPNFLVINEMPSIATVTFQDRKRERGFLVKAVSRPGFRLVRLEGGDGIGKTAMLRTLRDEHMDGEGTTPLRAFVYFSARGYRWITVPTLLEDLLAAAGPAAPAGLVEDVRGNPWRVMLPKVTAALARRPVAVVIDDADELFDDCGIWRDRDLANLLRDLARHDNEIKVVMSVRGPKVSRPVAPDPALDGRTEQVNLDRGLPVPDAKSFLKGLTGDGTISADRVELLLDRTGGHPRALELVAGVVLRHDLVALDTVARALNEPSQAYAQLFQFLFGRLSLDERRVVQALAVFARQVPARAVAALLKEIAPALDAEPLLRSLRTAFVIRGYDEHYYLPAAEAELARASLITEDEVGSSSSLTVEALWRRGVTYFASQRLPEPKRAEDLWPQYGEVELCLRSCRWEHALRVMNDIDDRFLTRWGQSHVLGSWREQLRGNLRRGDLEGSNLSHMVAARRQFEGHTDDLGDIREALRFAESSSPISVPTVTVQMANALVGLGRTADAERYFRLATADAAGDDLMGVEIDARAGRAQCLVKAGAFDEAEMELDEAARITRKLEPPRFRDGKWIHLLRMRGWVARQRGDYWLANRLLQRALELAEETGDDLPRGQVLASMATSALVTALPDAALDLAVQAAAIGVRLDNHTLLREANLTQSLALLDLADIDEAGKAAERGARYATRPGALGILGVQGLIAFRQHDHDKARRVVGEALDLLRALGGRDVRDDRDYQLWDAEGVVRCGSALLGDRPIDEAITAFENARAIAAEPGLLSYNDLVLRQFGERADPTMLTRVHRAACGAGYGGFVADRRFTP
ncbi:glycosyltransferase [Micromonospora sp. DT228]|uniref:glycosyltransferase n=1 Tax=Micromonospora sp. DT228 TaxID=3393443 RepID=UPI003CF00B56